MDHDALMKTAVKVLFACIRNAGSLIFGAKQDFSVLALSSKRAERKDVEATAYASLGVIHDNQANYILVIHSPCYRFSGRS